MSYYDKKENAESYIKMADGYDGRELIEMLKTYLEPGSNVLELGMGPGTDFEILSETYTVTGSDYVQTFLDIYRKQNADADLLLLDAVTLTTERKFDCIYSNKVLYHLTKDDLQLSFQKQAQLLDPNGILLHTFWFGDTQEENHGLHFAYYTEETLSALLGNQYEVLEMVRYTEMDNDDSICLIVRRN